ncbi:MAG: hypothetical protein ACXWUG_06885 [Polyangiales bacterium]
MRWFFVASLMAGCSANGGGDQTGKPTSDATSDTATTGDGSIFPTEDAMDETDASDSAMSAETAPTCGMPTQPCCGTSCSTGYCHSGTCYATPEDIEETSDTGLCADLGVTHVAPAFFERFTIHGRPGASAYRYYKKISCAGATAMIAPGSPMTLASDGSYSYVIENTANTDCSNANIGKYEVWAVVDGVESAHHEVSNFNSSCTTCAGAATLCP